MSETPTIPCPSCDKDMIFVGEIYTNNFGDPDVTKCQEFYYCPECLEISVLTTIPEQEEVISQADYALSNLSVW